jgi:hypothetical protein
MNNKTAEQEKIAEVCKPIRERLRKFISERTGDYPIVQTAVSLGCLVSSIYVPLRELEDEGLLKRRKTYFTILPEPTEEEIIQELIHLVEEHKFRQTKYPIVPDPSQRYGKKRFYSRSATGLIPLIRKYLTNHPEALTQLSKQP